MQGMQKIQEAVMEKQKEQVEKIVKQQNKTTLKMSPEAATVKL